LGWNLISLINQPPQWVRKFSIVYAAIFGFVTASLCARFIVDAPLLLTLARSACFLPFWICVFWPSLAVSRVELRKMSARGLVFRLTYLLIVVGFGALSFAIEIYRGVAAELMLRDTTGASKDLIQAMHEQANELTSLALTWVAYGFGIGVLALIVFGAIWIRRSFVEIAAIKESPELDKDKIFVVGDRGL
jgi:Ca2+/Na+ antiporter